MERVLGFTIKHGYEPWWALIWIALMIGVGWVIFKDAAYRYQAMVPAKERVYMAKEYQTARKLPPEYPRLSPLIYSADVFLPIVDLHQEEFWLPDQNTPFGKFTWFYLWVHIGLGWLLTSIFVLGLTPIFRKD